MRPFYLFIIIYLCFLPLTAKWVISNYFTLSNDPVPYPGGTLIVNHKTELILYIRGGSQRIKLPASYISSNQLPVILIKALLFQEDQTFYQHRGYSIREMKNSVFEYLFRNRALRGASTITQQLARTLFLNRSKSLKRKLMEIRIARILEKNLNKDIILELYLNCVYWGKNRYGIQAAATYYFNKSAPDLTPLESISLVSILPNPDSCEKPIRCLHPATAFRQKRLLRYLTGK